MTLSKDDVMQSLFTIDMLASLLNQSEHLNQKQRGYAVNLHGLANKLINELQWDYPEETDSKQEYQIWSLGDNEIYTFWGKRIATSFQSACDKMFSGHPDYDGNQLIYDFSPLCSSREELEDLLR
jgi:hypothetical protein